MLDIILTIICILNCVLFITSLYLCVFKYHKDEIESEEVRGFIYYITLSSIKDINCDITDYHSYREYIEIMAYLKVLQEIELDEELNQQIEIKYNRSRQSNIDIEEFDDVADNNNDNNDKKTTDITNDLINFMK